MDGMTYTTVRFVTIQTDTARFEVHRQVLYGDILALNPTAQKLINQGRNIITLSSTLVLLANDKQVADDVAAMLERADASGFRMDAQAQAMAGVGDLCVCGCALVGVCPLESCKPTAEQQAALDQQRAQLASELDAALEAPSEQTGGEA